MSIKNTILFSLILLDEVLREFRDPGGFVSFSYKNMYGFVPDSYKKKNFYSLTRNLKKSGDIRLKDRGKFGVTREGKKRFTNIFPSLRYLNKPWDRKWRVVGFDIQEKKKILRNHFRAKLYKFGFRLLQKSVYISPLPLEQDVESFISFNREQLENTYIFVSDKFFFEDYKGFIERVFNLGNINKKYLNLLERMDSRLSREENDQIVREFLGISAEDPFLPKELLPDEFAREKVWNKLKEVGIFED